MQDFPSGPELLDSVAAYLFSELRPQVPKEERFKVLVAANLCAVVARELRAGSAPSMEDVRLFSELLGAEDAGEPTTDEAPAAAREAASELSRRLREGSLDDRLDLALERLPEHVRRKLEIARPGYAL